MKVLAMYLPQFHRVRENDEWWGKGYTEWSAVKSAEKLFEDHEQPRVPQNDNYYNLLDKDTMVWQARLMHAYHIDGMCFYHYYFKNGRKILERPAENLLQWHDIDMPFCFSWANESWIRTWSKFSDGSSNGWTEKFEKGKTSEDDEGVLVKQEYGCVDDWDSHYYYLVNFFKDTRYIKYNDMPVFVIYKPMYIPCLKDMLTRWDELAKNDGFPGVYTIGTNVKDKKRYGLKGCNLQEPQETISRFFSERGTCEGGVIKNIDYDEMWKKIITKQVPKNASIGACVGFDSTPRHGRYGMVIRNRSPFIFYDGMRRLLLKAMDNNSPFVFLNAWNEWGEGMYLEPDERFGAMFLEAFCQARKSVEIGCKEKTVATDDEELQVLGEEITSLTNKMNRYRGYWEVLDAWVSLLEREKTIAHYLRKEGYQNVAIYGYGMLGKHLIYQLRKEGYKVLYVVEEKKYKKSYDVDVYTMDDKLPDVDLVIVTVMYDYTRIHDRLLERINADIISIWMVVNEAFKNGCCEADGVLRE